MLKKKLCVHTSHPSAAILRNLAPPKDIQISFLFLFLFLFPLSSRTVQDKGHVVLTPSRACRPSRSPAAAPLTTPPRHRHTRPHPIAIRPTPPLRPPLIDVTSTGHTRPHPPPPCPQATHLAAASTQSHPHPAASAPHLLPHFPGLHPSYYIVAACTFISYIILHE